MPMSTLTSTTSTRVGFPRVQDLHRSAARAASVLREDRDGGSPPRAPGGPPGAGPGEEPWVTKRQLAAHLQVTPRWIEMQHRIRPSEIFALHKDEVDLDEQIIGVRWQIDSRTRKRVPTKDGDPRWVVPSPRFRAHLQIIMQYDRTILYPAIRGGYLSLSNWYPHWNAVRVAAGMANLEFYELKHRALQWMVDPIEDGGLGLDHATAAEMAGHDDGGWLIANVYTKLAERRARERAKRAMRDYAERHPSADRKLPADTHPGQQASEEAASPRSARVATTTTYTSTTEQAPTFWSAGGALTRREYAELPVAISLPKRARAA